MSDQVETQIRKIIADLAMLDMADVTPEASMESLGVDSMALVEAIFAIEEAFDIEVPFNANEPANSDFDITNVASMVSAIESLVAAKG